MATTEAQEAAVRLRAVEATAPLYSKGMYNMDGRRSAGDVLDDLRRAGIDLGRDFTLRIDEPLGLAVARQDPWSG